MPSRSRSRALRPAPSLTARRTLRGGSDHARACPRQRTRPVFAPDPPRQRQAWRTTVAPRALLAPVAHAAVGGGRAAITSRPAPTPPVDPTPPPRGQLMLPGFAPVAAVRRIAAPMSGVREVLAAYPDIPASELCRHAKRLGKSAELLVDSLLMRLGERSYPAEEHEAFDRLLWLPGGPPLRVQIKARHRRTGDLWVFSVTKGYGRSPEGVRPYGDDEFDLLALVVLPEGVVKFAARGAAHHRIHQREIAALRASPRGSLDAALGALGLGGAVPRRPASAAA